MRDGSLRRLGAVCSILVGISYLLVGITYFLLPQAQRGGFSGDPATVLPSIAQDSTYLTLLNWEFGLGALFAIGAILAITEVVRPMSEGWARWTANLAILGFFVQAIDSFRSLALADRIAKAYAAGDASAKAAIAATGATALDPQGWLIFGAVGVWVLTASVLVLRGAALPKTLGYVGVATGVLLWLTLAGVALQIQSLIAIGAGLGGVILAPVWYIGIGWALRRASAAAMTTAPRGVPAT